MSKMDKRRTLIGAIVVPSATGALILWWTQNGVFAVCMASIPFAWELIRLYVEHETTFKKKVYVFFANHGVLPSKDWLRRSASLPRVYPRANVESILTPRLQEVLKDGGTLVTVAGDGYSIHAENYAWSDKILTFLRSGCSVYQYAAAPNDKADAKFRDLEREWSDSFHYRRLASPQQIRDKNDRFLIATLATFHPTYAVGCNGEKILWVERFHPAQSTEATGCTFYSQEDLEINPSPFNEFETILNRAWAITKDVQGIA